MNQILIDDKAFLLKSYLRCSHCNGMDIFEPELTQMPLLQEHSLLKDSMIIMKIHKFGDIKIIGNSKTIYESMKILI